MPRPLSRATLAHLTPLRRHASFHRLENDGGGVNRFEVKGLDIGREKNLVLRPITPRGRRKHDCVRRTMGVGLTTSPSLKLEAKGSSSRKISLQVLYPPCCCPAHDDKEPSFD